MLSNRIAYLDVLRGIAIVCVVLGHAIQKCNCMVPTDGVQSIIATFQMALFFLQFLAMSHAFLMQSH